GALLVMVSTSVLSLWLGLLVVFAVIVSLLPFRLEPTPIKMGIAGFFSGFFGTSSGIGGPPMALLLQHQDANQLRGNLSAFFVFSSIISLV
ncbi:sulfite exporter TauE/SafE family protein, partial [Vibrio lentus]